MSERARAATEGGPYQPGVGAALRGGPPTNRVAVLFALEREAAPFRRAARGAPGVRVEVCGVGVRRARACAEQVLADGPELVVMAGFCGALRDGLPVGAVVIPAEAVDEHGGRWGCQVSREPESAEASAGIEPVSESCSTGLWPVQTSRRPEACATNTLRLLTSTSLVATPADKRELAERFNADVVDMESAAVAAACAERGVPFAAVRAVSDAVETALSPELVRLLAGGTVSIPKACAALLRKPSLLREFFRLARDTKRAADNLAAELLPIVRKTVTKM